jgi:hypothetical protein
VEISDGALMKCSHESCGEVANKSNLQSTLEGNIYKCIYTTNDSIILLLNKLEINRRQTGLQFIQLRYVEINGKLKILIMILMRVPSNVKYMG